MLGGVTMLEKCMVRLPATGGLVNRMNLHQYGVYWHMDIHDTRGKSSRSILK